MKLSQLNTDEALDVLCEITPLISSIVSDDALMTTLGKAVKREGLTKAGIMLLGAEKLTKLAPILLKDHRAEVYGVVAALNQTTAEEIASQNIIKTSAQIREILRDKDLLAFFRSCAEPEKNE